MLNSVLANFYERDIRKLIEEVNLFKNEENLWRTQGSVKNSMRQSCIAYYRGLELPYRSYACRLGICSRSRSGVH